ncbi:hypothetical protein RB595_002728 [Gaeumannomyces hyphopodioides]
MASNTTQPTMLQLSTDKSFHFELLRFLGLSAYDGAGVGEVLTTAQAIIPGNFESFSSSFKSMADRVLSRAKSIVSGGSGPKVSARSAFFAAATYFRGADFYLHGNASDPRLTSLWASQTEAFDQAIALLPHVAVRETVRAPGFDIPTLWYEPRPDGARNGTAAAAAKRPTLIIGTGFDGSHEELYHTMGIAALERGYNVLTYEGPGQPSVRRGQGLGFIPDWERVVTPLLDGLLSAHADAVDPAAVGLVGLSFGGYLAPRAAAFEPDRLAAVMAVDGLFDFGAGLRAALPDAVRALLDAGDRAAVDALLPRFTDPASADTDTRWGVEHGMWALATNGSLYDFFKAAEAYSLADKNVTDRIRMPVFVGQAEQERFFGGNQAKVLKDALGDRAVLHTFEAADGAGDHCAVAAMKLQNQVVFDWFQSVIEGR